MNPNLLLHDFRTRAASLLLALALFFVSHAVMAGPPVISATKDVVGGNTRKNPGDTVTYKITIGNSNAVGTLDATGLQLHDAAPNQTSDAANTLNVTPVAIDDTYGPHVIANTSINTANSIESGTFLANRIRTPGCGFTSCLASR